MQLDYIKCSFKDLGQLVHISKTTFRAAFEAENNPEDFKNYLDFAFNKDKLTSELLNPQSSFYFVFLRKKVVGYFKLNIDNAQTDMKTMDCIELERIYVVEELQGKGIGARILKKIKHLAHKTGKSFLWLGVWENNASAIKFYQKNGFTKFGMHPYYIGNDKQMDWLMKFDLINFRPK